MVFANQPTVGELDVFVARTDLETENFKSLFARHLAAARSRARFIRCTRRIACPLAPFVAMHTIKITLQNLRGLRVRRRGRMPAFDPARDSLAASGLSPSTALVKDERARLLKRAIATLPLEQQVTLELFYWEQLRGKDIADVLGVSQHTVRSRLARAKDALKQAITELAEEPQLASETVEGLDTWAKRIAPDTD